MSEVTDPNDPGLDEILPNGQQKNYVVLTEEERAKGYQRPLRYAYVHEKCGVVTTMSHGIAETYAVNPKFYGATYCAGCCDHFPVGEYGEFTWDKTDIKVGT
jgi:hypothetical protein